MLDHFDYFQPTDIQELFSFYDGSGSSAIHMLAGGTDLIPALRAKRQRADLVVDLGGLGLDYIRQEDGAVRIGATVTFRTLIRSGPIRRHCPVLALAAGKLGAVQTQSIATLGGNLCSGLPSADSAPPLIVLGAALRLVSADGERLVNAEDFFTGPGTTVLRRGELLSEIIVPVRHGRYADFIKVGRRKGMSLAILNSAASFGLDANGMIDDARIAVGAAGPTPIRATEAERLLNGKEPSPALFEQAAQLVMDSICPRTSIRGSAEYRCLLSAVLVRRNLEHILRQTGKENGV